jgi:hypothetical protein
MKGRERTKETKGGRGGNEGPRKAHYFAVAHDEGTHHDRERLVQVRLVALQNLHLVRQLLGDLPVAAPPPSRLFALQHFEFARLLVCRNHDLLQLLFFLRERVFGLFRAPPPLIGERVSLCE